MDGVGEKLHGKQRGETLVGLPENGSVPPAVDEQCHGVIEKFDGHGTVVVVGSICGSIEKKKINYPPCVCRGLKRFFIT